MKSCELSGFEFTDKDKEIIMQVANGADPKIMDEYIKRILAEDLER